MLAKIAQSRTPNWVIEHPIDVGHKRYRVDAYNTKYGTIREFVHTATPYYYQKHLDLRKARHNHINWLFDGEQFVSKLSRYIPRKGDRSPGHSEFLKDTPFQLFEKIGGLVHYENRIWTHWKNNVWFHFDHPDAKRFLVELDRARKDLDEFGTAVMVQTERLAREPKQDGSSAVLPQ
jgi:hypothetical protein